MRKREPLGASCWHDMTRQSCGSHKLNEITILPLNFSFQVLKTTKTCFHFPSPTSIFFEYLSHENNDPKLSQTKGHPWDPLNLDDGS